MITTPWGWGGQAFYLIHWGVAKGVIKTWSSKNETYSVATPPKG